MTLNCPQVIPELESLLSRIREKREDYERYGFSMIQGRTLRAFFDLAQEYETMENFYRICVYVPKEFMGLEARLCLVDPEDGRLLIACDTIQGLKVCGASPPHGIELCEAPYETGESFVAPIRGNRRLIAARPVTAGEELIGVFEVFPISRFKRGDRLFFEKYANRIGYNLHYKQIALQNVSHLKFINALVADIEHNVIVPNMRYKLFLNNLKHKLQELKKIEGDLRERLVNTHGDEFINVGSVEEIRARLAQLNSALLEQYEEVLKHYQNTSLFLESLLRRDHFEKGHLVLRRRKCRFKKEVIDSQLERYRSRLERRGIKVNEELGGVPDEDILLAVDVGLISQVYANLFSNAEKYCREVVGCDGNPLKYMSYGREIIRDFFGPGKDGIKFNVFTTGPHLSPEETVHIFEEGFRGIGADKRPGAGHGLHFVKKIIEVHGGRVGCEVTDLGNNFYFVLPLQSEVPSYMEGMEDEFEAE